MSDTQGYSESTLPITDRRAHKRRRALPLAYIDLGGNNGGIVLNISAGGLAITAVEVLHQEHLPRMRFQLPQTNLRVEATGEIAWTGESKKEAGVRFVDLSDDAALQINNWLSSSAAEVEIPPRRQMVHRSARRPFSTIMEAEQTGSLSAPAAAAQGAEKKVAEALPGSSFTAALQNTRAASGDAAEPIHSGAPAEQVNHAQTGDIFSAGRDRGAPEKRWWALTTLVSLFAVISFVAGMATGGGGWDGVLRLIAGRPVTESEPAKGDESAGGAARLNSAPSLADNPPRSGGDTSPAKSQDPRPTASDAGIIRRPDASAPAARPGQSARKENSGISLKLPENPVSASASVAITSRRSFQVAPEDAPQGSHQGPNVQIGQLFYRVEPFYPADAERQGIEGTVEVHAHVGRDGKIQTAEILSGPPQLAEAAVKAVRDWRYKPTLLNGQPIESEVDVKMTFRLPGR